MRHYAGLDVSLEETAICVVDETGKVIRELRAASEPDALVETLAATGLSFERVGLQACSLSSWLHQELTRAGLPAFCIETRACQCVGENKVLKTIIRDHLEGTNGRDKAAPWIPRWMAFPSTGYTTRGGVGSVAASALVAAIRAELDEQRCQPEHDASVANGATENEASPPHAIAA